MHKGPRRRDQKTKNLERLRPDIVLPLSLKNEAVFTTATACDIDGFIQAIEAGGDPHVKNAQGETPLIAVIKTKKWKQKIAIVSKLTEKMVNLDVQDNMGNTALSLACENGDMAVVEMLCEVRYGAPDLMRGPIECVVAADGTLQRKKLNPIIIACEKRHHEMLQKLVSTFLQYEGDDQMDLIDINDAEINDIEIDDVEKPKTLSAEEQILWDATCARDFAAVQQWFLQYVPPRLPLPVDDDVKAPTIPLPIDDGVEAPTIPLPIDDGVEAPTIPLAPVMSNQTLWDAAREGNLDTVNQWLLAAAKDPTLTIDATDANGDSALVLASKHHHSHIAVKLLDWGASPTGVCCETEDRSVLLWAIAHGQIDLVRALASDPRVDLNARNSHGLTPLTLAAKQGNKKIIALLLGGKNKAAINLPSEEAAYNGYSPFLCAIACGNKDVAEQLMDKHADINLPGKDGMTPLMWASKLGYHKLVKRLLKEGADPNAQTVNGHTAVVFASEGAHIPIALTLFSAINAEQLGMNNAQVLDNSKAPQQEAAISAELPLITKAFASFTWRDRRSTGRHKKTAGLKKSPHIRASL